jgi:hypothetical protein
MNEDTDLSIAKVCEAFRPSQDDMTMIVLTRSEYESLVKAIASKAVEYGFYDGLSHCDQVRR